MTDFASCLYFGEVVHQRYSPRRHRLRYRVFQGLFDLDELPGLSQKLKLFSHNGINLFAFYDCDHGDGGPLRPYLEKLAEQTGMSVAGGRIAVLCMPRILGFVFNPLSIFYCYDHAERLAVIVYEVNNTFGQRHSYVIPVESQTHDNIRQTCNKEFHVSPFMGMEMTYDFKITLPGATLATVINGNHSGGAPLIFASFTGARRPLADKTLLAALLFYPALTLGVVAAIHWEAVKLLAKGMRLRLSPPRPAKSVTVVERSRTSPEVTLRAEVAGHVHKMDKQSA